MFYSPGIEKELEGPTIDRLDNVISLHKHVHNEFGNFHFWLEETSGDPTLQVAQASGSAQDPAAMMSRLTLDPSKQPLKGKGDKSKSKALKVPQYDLYFDMRRKHIPLALLPRKSETDLVNPHDPLYEEAAPGYLRKVSGVQFQDTGVYSAPNNDFLKLHAAFAYALLISLGAD